VQFRQEARTAGAVASDGDLATNSQIVGSEGRPLDLKGRESTEERSRTLAVSDRCDVGRMVAAAAAIQRQCERVRRRRLCVAVRRSGVVVSFAVIAAIALRRHRRLFRIRCVICRRYRVFVAIYSSSPSLFISCIIIVSPCTFTIVASRFHSLHYFNLLFCLSVMDSFFFFLVGLSVCQLRDSAETFHTLLQQRRALVKIIFG
jgi:hypothetical protein